MTDEKSLVVIYHPNEEFGKMLAEAVERAGPNIDVERVIVLGNDFLDLVSERTPSLFFLSVLHRSGQIMKPEIFAQNCRRGSPDQHTPVVCVGEGPAEDDGRTFGRAYLSTKFFRSMESSSDRTAYVSSVMRAALYVRD